MKKIKNQLPKIETANKLPQSLEESQKWLQRLVDLQRLEWFKTYFKPARGTRDFWWGCKILGLGITTFSNAVWLEYLDIYYIIFKYKLNMKETWEARRRYSWHWSQQWWRGFWWWLFWRHCWAKVSNRLHSVLHILIC